MRFQTLSVIALAIISPALAAQRVGTYRDGEVQPNIKFNKAVEFGYNPHRDLLPGVPQPRRGNQVSYGRKTRKQRMQSHVGPDMVDPQTAQVLGNDPRDMEEQIEFEKRNWEEDVILEARSPAKGGAGGKTGGGKSSSGKSGGVTGFANKVGKIANKVGRVANAVSVGYKAYKGGKRDMRDTDWDFQARELDEFELEARNLDDELELGARNALLDINDLD